MSPVPDPALIPDERAPAVDRWMDRLVIAAFLVALIAPGVAWLLGVRPESLEARTAAALPTFDVERILDPEVYAEVDRAIADGFALRSLGVRTHALVDYGLLGGTTNPDVLVGLDGWLFPTAARDTVCRHDAGDLLDSLDRARRMAIDHGRDFRFVLVPDKHAIYPDKIRPGSGLGAACTNAKRKTMALGLSQRPEFTVALWDDLSAARAADPSRPVYYSQDTHWTPSGALIAAERLIRSVDPSVWDPDEVRVGPPIEHVADLSRLMGLPSIERGPEIRTRPDVRIRVDEVETDVHLREAPSIPWYRVDPAAPAIEGRTLVVYDSYFGNEVSRLRPWFRESIWVHVNDLIYLRELIPDLPDVDRVIFERVERLAYNADVAEVLEPILRRPRD